MIVYEKEDTYVLIAQQDHARISGDLMAAWQEELLGERISEVIQAAYEHDRSWAGLDVDPIWNDAAGRPYSFRDFPPNIRFLHYRHGIDELERINPYAAVLSSLLYTMLAERADTPETRAFVSREKGRQANIQAELGLYMETLHYHLNALVLCDELSLFLCMEPPGTPIRQYEWFASGFVYPQPRGCGGRRIKAQWQGDHVVVLSEGPFARPVDTVLAYKEVCKGETKQLGIAAAYKQAELRSHRVRFLVGEVK
ncbi:DUF3891 family protein [Paenibacillus methanolicus]|uniref:Uncharacterized protein DUF3891 n=1 Tax=Paenibacillus methanolicus TaxID=582686 RepID=A0A5S5C013_9BACL|nr:DUF3891 family protein [Paenibacillus methanolicus]TYP72617.1 uncharacterized protein DUF3891 [Paenibacillus methanolicus]